MLREASWIVSAFIIITVALAGVCARHVDKRNHRDHSKQERNYNNRPVTDEKPVPREYKDPGEYIVDAWK